MLQSLGYLAGNDCENNRCLVLYVVKRWLPGDELFIPRLSKIGCQYQVMADKGMILTSIIVLPNENTSVRGDLGGASSVKSSGAIQAGFPARFQLEETENMLNSSIA